MNFFILKKFTLPSLAEISKTKKWLSSTYLFCSPSMILLKKVYIELKQAANTNPRSCSIKANLTIIFYGDA